MHQVRRQDRGSGFWKDLLRQNRNQPSESAEMQEVRRRIPWGKEYERIRKKTQEIKKKIPDSVLKKMQLVIA